MATPTNQFDPLSYIQGKQQVQFKNLDELKGFLDNVNKSAQLFHTAGNASPLDAADNIKKSLAQIDQNLGTYRSGYDYTINSQSDSMNRYKNLLQGVSDQYGLNLFDQNGGINMQAYQDPNTKSYLAKHGLYNEKTGRDYVQSYLNTQQAIQQATAQKEAAARGELPPEVIAQQNELLGTAAAMFSDAFKKVAPRLAKTQADLKQKLANEGANIANTLDFGSANTPEERAKLEARAAQIKADLQPYIDAANALGLDTSALTNAFSKVGGSFVPTSEISPAMLQAKAAGGREGQTTTVKQQPDGTFAIVGADGSILEGGMKDITSALARQTERQSGFVEPIKTAPTPVDNVIDARSFVEGGSKAEVGGVPNLLQGAKSPIFTDGSGGLFYIPAGSNQPVKISDPNQLQQLAASGAIEVNQTRRPLSEAESYLKGQTTPSPTTGGGSDLLGNVGNSGTGTGGGVLSGITGQPQGFLEQLAQKFQQVTAPIDQTVFDAQKAIKDFQPTDLTTLKTQLESQGGIDKIMNELSNIDQQIADLVGIERRVPETTLARAQNTMIEQGILDRQRTVELQKLSDAAAPLTDLKNVLEQDLTRRNKLVSDALDLKKESDSFKLQQLGYALDFAVQNRSITMDRANQLFEAASKDYQMGIESAQEKAKLAAQALKDQNKAIADFYEAQGYVVDPITGKLEPTLELEKFQKSSSKGSGSGSGGTPSEISSWTNAVKLGLPITSVPQKLRADVTNELSSLSTQEQINNSKISSPIDVGGGDKKVPVEKNGSYYDPETGAFLGSTMDSAQRALAGIGTSSAEASSQSTAQDRADAVATIQDGLSRGMDAGEIFNAIFNSTNLSASDIRALLEQNGLSTN